MTVLVSGHRCASPGWHGLWNRLALLAVLVILLLPTDGLLAQQGTRPRSPRYCGRCHENAYAHWAESAHNVEAFRGERFQTIWERQRRASKCLACHATRQSEEDDILYQGVTCTACHRPIGETYDPTVREHVEMSIPESSLSCAGCHGGDHARTFGEWQASAHNGPREVSCMACHDAHTGGLVNPDLTALCGSCHMQPVPTVSAHMHVDSGCTDCHPAPISTDNVHMGGDEPVAGCTDCHMLTAMDSWGLYLANAGHMMTVPLAVCVNCHGKLHTLGSTTGATSP
ncbi:MAG: hypothetical protein HPY64_02210 [Anaerolineae bacterium]|nr:hypothetical protein [Anaerolineae bacterium]